MLDREDRTAMLRCTGRQWDSRLEQVTFHNAHTKRNEGELENEELFVLHRPEERVSQGDLLYVPIKDEIQTASYIAKCVL